jgi:predicted Zn-dependent protease
VPAGRFLSEAECRVLVARVTSFARGGGDTTLFIDSQWIGNLRWARNGILFAGDQRNNGITVRREIGGVLKESGTTVLDDRHLLEAVRMAERGIALRRELPASSHPEPRPPETYLRPTLWYETTYQQDAAQRATLMQQLVKPAADAGMLSAGDIVVSAIGRASMDETRLWYYPYTQARYSVTVRAPDGSASGWAGMDHNDWSRIDAEKLSQLALEKCLAAHNPVRLEPGRYTTILEPQAVGDFVQILFAPNVLDRQSNEGTILNLGQILYGGDPTIIKKTDPRYKKAPQAPYNDAPGYSKIGEQVIDPRLSVTTDCTDPDLGFPPFKDWNVYRPVTWIQDGILTQLAYGPQYAARELGKSEYIMQYGAPGVGGAFHMRVKGPTTSVDEMIATTDRGLLVTRFAQVAPVPSNNKTAAAALMAGYTRDGLWLIEHGKISKPVKNFRFTESPVFALNNVEQVGTPRRIFNPDWPIVVPALKVRDFSFSFTSLSEAI